MNKNPLEKDIEKYLCKVCIKKGGLAAKINPINLSGFPDRLVLLPGGRMMFVELKRKGLKPRPLQEHIHKNLRNLGFRVEVIDTKEKVDEVVNRYDLQTPWVSRKCKTEDIRE